MSILFISMPEWQTRSEYYQQLKNINMKSYHKILTLVQKKHH